MASSQYGQCSRQMPLRFSCVQLEGSCDCGQIRFSVWSSAPDPYRVCHCRRCRKTAGGVGAAINILADADSLVVRGELNPSAYEASPGLTMKFCPACASTLFIELARWPQWVYPFASAIDSPLPVPPHRIHIQWAERVAWSPVMVADEDRVFDRNTPESIVDWHERMGRLQTS